MHIKTKINSLDLPKNSYDLSGIHLLWKSDSRNFSQILHDWIDYCGDTDDWLHQVGLSHILSHEDVINLLACQKVPANPLTRYLSACIPVEVASPTVLRHRGDKALAIVIPSNNSQNLLDPDKGALRNARMERFLMLVKTGGSTQSKSSAFVEEILYHLEGATQHSGMEPVSTLKNIAQYLGIEVDSLYGKIPLKHDHAMIVAEELAALLKFEDKAFDIFSDRATNILCGIPNSLPSTPAGIALRFARLSEGLTQQELAAHTKLGVREISQLECDNIVNKRAFKRVCNALHLNENELEALEAKLSQRQQAAQLTPAMQEVVQRFRASGLTSDAYLHAGLRQPNIFHLSSSRVIDNITGVIEYFANAGLTEKAYIQKALLKKPCLFYQSDKTIIANISGAVKRFQNEKLELKQYIDAALQQASLFMQSPQKIEDNIRGVSDRFASEGLTSKAYLYNAALKQPSLFTQAPQRIEYNIRTVVGHFAKEGLTTADYLYKAALKSPQLFYQSPLTITHNIDEVVKQFAHEGLTAKDYLAAALKQPTLFSRSPETIGRNIRMILQLYDEGVFALPSSNKNADHFQYGHADILAQILRYPIVLTFDDTNLYVRKLHKELVGDSIPVTIFQTRREIEHRLIQHFGCDNPQSIIGKGFIAGEGKPSVDEAKNFVLRALMREGYIKGAKTI